MHYTFQDRENVYIVMDYLGGGDLRYHICKQRRFSEDQTRFFVSCIILALDYLHYNSIIHRDIKPENLVFDDKGYLHLTDLGITRLYRKDKTIIDSSGTPGYMAPEVITNQNHDLSSDYFAVGIIVYEFMFGKRPYLGKTRKEIKDQILIKEVHIKSSEIPTGWSGESADFVNKLLKRKSNSRLGKSGINEIKSHPWLKNVSWMELYKKELISPYIPKYGDNFDSNYCRRQEAKEDSYDITLAKVNEEKYFQDFYYDKNDKKTTDKEKYFELDGEKYIFKNIHEEKLRIMKNSEIKTSISNASNNLFLNKFYENIISISQTNLPSNSKFQHSNSVVIHRKEII